MVPLALGDEREGSAQNVGRKMDVRIGENQPFALRLFETRDQRMRFSEPAGRQIGDVHDLQVIVLLFSGVEDRRRGVFRTIIDGHDFETEGNPAREGWPGLRGVSPSSSRAAKITDTNGATLDDNGAAFGQPGELGHPYSCPSALNDPESCDGAENRSPEDVQSRIFRET